MICQRLGLLSQQDTMTWDCSYAWLDSQAFGMLASI